MKETIVISGPMSGIPNHNLDAFYQAELSLKGLGFSVKNPAYLVERVLKHSLVEPGEPAYRRVQQELKHMIATSNSICLLPGWEKSNGAKQLLATAIDLGRNVLIYSDLVSNQAVFDWFKSEQEQIDVIDSLCRDAHINSNNHGWWEEERSFGEIVALIHSELSEALEYARKDPLTKSNHIVDFLGIEEEFADVLIRIFDYCGKKKYRLGQAIVEKMKFNIGRPKKHGKRF